MNGMGMPVECRVLHDGQVLTAEAFVARRLHPANVGRVLTGIRVEAGGFSEHRPVGHDGATTERYPAIPAGHMRGDL